jgi:catechol 2,3-dioxygenase-like lactoylglutathione lyase family enzyme
VVDQAAGRPCRTAPCQHREGGNRFSVEVADLAGIVDRLRAAGVHVRNELVTGVGGKQVVIDDPSGNPVELFEPIRTEARLANQSRSIADIRPA